MAISAIKSTVIPRLTLPRFTRIRQYAVFHFDCRASALSLCPLSVQFATGLNMFHVKLFYVRSAFYL